MVKAAIYANDSRKGVSRPVILKYIVSEYNLDETKARKLLNLTLKRGLDKMVLMNPVKHTGSFKVVAKETKEKKNKSATKVSLQKGSDKKSPKSSTKKIVKKNAASTKKAKTVASTKKATVASKKKTENDKIYKFHF